MLHIISTDLQRPRSFKCQDLRSENVDDIQKVDARHNGIPGYNQEILSASTITLIGCGGINGEIGEGLARKGPAEIHMVDHKSVDLSNLNRQRFFKCDLDQNKAFALGKNLAKEGFMGTRLFGYPYFFQEAVEYGYKFPHDVLVCGVDNDETRKFVAQYGLSAGIPVIFIAVSRDGNQGYVFVQRPKSACYGCAFPDAVNNEITPCPGVPAIKDILKVVAGVALYAIDTVLMGRKRNWNYRLIHLAGYMPDIFRTIEPLADCPLNCSKYRESNETS